MPNIHKSKKWMVWTTHAAGALGLIFAIALIFWTKNFFVDVSLWAILLAVYAWQGPDIDMKHSAISKNPIVFIFRLFIGYFISWHRAKETHSFFGTMIFAIIFSPLIVILGLKSWIIVVIWYFSHLVLDFINPTGVKLFYFPFLNSNPRSWSVNNFIQNIVNPFKDHEARTQMGVKTGWAFESVYLISFIWIVAFLWFIFNFSAISWRIYTDSLLLATSPIILFIWIIWLFIPPKLFIAIMSIPNLFNFKNVTTDFATFLWNIFNHVFVAQFIFFILAISSLISHFDVLKITVPELKTNISNLTSWQISAKDFLSDEWKSIWSLYSSWFQMISSSTKDELLKNLQMPDINWLKNLQNSWK